MLLHCYYIDESALVGQIMATNLQVYFISIAFWGLKYRCLHPRKTSSSEERDEMAVFVGYTKCCHSSFVISHVRS